MLPGARLMRSLVALTPDDLSIGALFRTQPSFSARFDALSRSYRYRICAGDVRPVLAWDHAWWYKGQLNVGAMNEASKLLLGEHDFKSFCKATSAVDKPTCRYVSALDVRALEEAGENLVAIDITGNAFLHNAHHVQKRYGTFKFFFCEDVFKLLPEVAGDDTAALQAY